MGKWRGPVSTRVGDIVSRWPARRVQACQIAHPLSDLVICTGRIPADAQTTDDLSSFVQWHPAAEGDDAADDLAIATALPARRSQGERVKGIRVIQSKKRMARLHKGI